MFRRAQLVAMLAVTSLAAVAAYVWTMTHK